MGVQTLPAETGRLVLVAPRGLHGVEYALSFPSVGATETAILAAATAHGDTVLHGAACEPEVQDLARFLNACGACVEGAGSTEIHIRGQRALHGCIFAPMADRIVASTFACVAASAGGRVELCGCDPSTFQPLLFLLKKAGCTVETTGNSVSIERFVRLHGVGAVRTGVYPALATDAAPLLAAALLCADSVSSIEDTVFEHRFACAEGFLRLGAKTTIIRQTLHIAPCSGLHGGVVQAPDLRGGAALILAALAARGRTKIEHIDHIWRGYDSFAEMLAGLGLSVS
jgi:UDP-N-acetylglucosamine 1-carboxyvinyltransferase